MTFKTACSWSCRLSPRGLETQTFPINCRRFGNFLVLVGKLFSSVIIVIGLGACDFIKIWGVLLVILLQVFLWVELRGSGITSAATFVLRKLLIVQPVQRGGTQLGQPFNQRCWASGASNSSKVNSNTLT